MVGGSVDGLAFYLIALAAVGFDVGIALSADEACARASALRPKIIVIDCPAHNGAGSELLDRLNEDARTREIPLAVIGDLAMHSVRRPTHPKVAAFFPKPCSPQNLANGLRQLIQGR
jgi:CheY-like chemotaxis protein